MWTAPMAINSFVFVEKVPSSNTFWSNVKGLLPSRILDPLACPSMRNYLLKIVIHHFHPPFVCLCDVNIPFPVLEKGS
jgi:hypothetical protein